MKLSSPKKLNNVFLQQLFNSCSFPNKVSQGTFGTLPLTEQYLCDLRNAMPCHWSPSASHPTFP